MSRTGPVLAGHEPHTTHRIEQRLAIHVEAVRLRGRDQAPVVRELPLDQAGGHVQPTDPERGVALTEHQGDVGVVVERAGQLVERTGGHEHRLTLTQRRGAGQVADGEPVGVGGDHAQALALGCEQHAGEDGARLVGGRSTDDLLEPLRQVGGTEHDLLAVGIDQVGELVGRDGVEPEVGAAAADACLLAIGLDVDGPALERADDVHRELRREHRDPVGAARDLHLGGDGQVQVAAGESELVPAQGETKARQDRERRSGRGGALCGRQGVDQHISLTTELHGVSLSPPLKPSVVINMQQ